MELDGSLVACYTLRSEKYSSESAGSEMPLKKTEAITEWLGVPTKGRDRPK
jgi:hypothetical protein